MYSICCSDETANYKDLLKNQLSQDNSSSRKLINLFLDKLESFSYKLFYCKVNIDFFDQTIYNIVTFQILNSVIVCNARLDWKILKALINGVNMPTNIVPPDFIVVLVIITTNKLRLYRFRYVILLAKRNCLFKSSFFCLAIYF